MRPHLLIAGLLAALASGTAPPAYLEPLAFERLPVGAIRPSGWLQDQLQTAANGFTGHLCDFYNLCHNSTWMGGDQEAPNPEVLAYWLNGAAPLAFQLQDSHHLRGIVGSVVDYILEHPQADGLLGAPLLEIGTKGKPPRFGNGTMYWAKSVVVHALQQYAEGNASDSRTIPALKRHFASITEHQKTTPPAMWGASRWVESALGMQWMMDRGLGGVELLDSLHSLRNQSIQIYDWQQRFLDDGPIWMNWDILNLTEKELHHGVNLAEAIKLGAVWSRVTGQQSDLHNTAVALDRLTRIAGSPSGAFISDEVLTPPNTAARGKGYIGVVRGHSPIMFATRYRDLQRRRDHVFDGDGLLDFGQPLLCR